MWVASVLGFYSAVAARRFDGDRVRTDPDLIMVRARQREHLVALQERFAALAGEDILESGRADYRWRIFVPKAAWVEAVRGMAEEIDYDNFKAAAARRPGQSPAYVAALHRVWAAMAELQRTAGRPRPRRDGAEAAGD